MRWLKKWDTKSGAFPQTVFEGNDDEYISGIYLREGSLSI